MVSPMKRKALREHVAFILGVVEGQVFYGENSAVIITGDADGGQIIEVDADFHTHSADLGEWSTGFEA